MDKDVIEYRNALKELFKKYTLHKCIRLSVLNGLLDEINVYYQSKETSYDDAIKKLHEFHEQHLKEQLEGWIKHLTTVRSNMANNKDRNMGAVEGFDKVIQILKDVAER